MMAEANNEQSVDVSAHPLTTAEPDVAAADFRDVDSTNPTVNASSDEIAHRQIVEIVDELVNSAEASVSGGSDTEAYKGHSSKNPGESSHVRTLSSIKKPQSFKSVSVNRTFLGAKGATPSISRPDSATGSASSTPQPNVSSSASRLKLVAKSGSNLGGSTKTLSSNGKSGAPDPSTVWNRNRPPPPSEPKKFSDEELLAKGIHMAGRLVSEEANGQSNWADIDDDEEWAPETITWGDGTQITLPQADEIAPSPKPLPASIVKETIASPKPKSPVPTLGSTGSPSVKSSVLVSGKGLVLKGAPEKPTLVAKPPPPTAPTRSPWAPLPPVDKASPVVMDLPSQAQPPRYTLREASSTTSATPPPPAKEIAADDFSRQTWRDGHATSNKELFNSQSGRYEPVSERRDSRADIPNRQPAVLQRPPHQEQHGPAEPSAAFQTRSSAQEGPYGRRRGSSNVSGGSGNFASLAHRMSLKTHETIPQPDILEPTTQTGPIPQVSQSPVSTTATSPAQTQAYVRANASQPYLPRPSPSHAQAPPHLGQPVAEVPPQGNDEEQRKFMLQRREEAIRRRLEEEAREEEAKKARIAEKLKALGPAPERKSTKKESGSVPSQIVQRTEIPASLTTKQAEPAIAKSADSSSSPPIAPKTEAATEKEKVPATAIAGSTSEPPKPKMERSQVNGNVKPSSSQNRGPASRSPTDQDGTSGASWPQETWKSGSRQVSRNVWAAPGNDRSLGNGTFNADLGSVPDSHPGQISTNLPHRPTPIGPPRGAAPPNQPRQPELTSARIAPIGPPGSRIVPPVQNQQKAAPTNNWKSFSVEDDDRRRMVDHKKHLEVVGDVAPPMTDSWRPIKLGKDGKRVESKLQTKNNEEASGDISRSVNPVVEDSSLKTTIQLPRQDARFSATPPETTQRPPPTGPSGAAPSNHSSQIRGESRFYPKPKDLQQQDVESREESLRPKSPTPPPPTADGHPVYDGDARHPHVALPPQRPRVKLPPSAQPAAQPTAPGADPPMPKHAPVSFAAALAAAVPQRPPPPSQSSSGAARPVSRGVGYGGIPQKPHEITTQESWQDRINSLMGKKSLSPPKSMPIDAFSKTAFEYNDITTVSLPSLSPASSELTNDSAFTSREMAEECFGEQEMGSLPPVRLPTKTPEAAWQAVTINWNPPPAKLRIDPSVAEEFKFPFDFAHGRNVIRISAPGMSEVKTVTAPPTSNRSNSNSRRSVARGGSSRRVSRAGGQRGGRDGPSDHSSDQFPGPSAGRPTSYRGRGGYRPRTENWGRHVSAASVAQS